MNHGVRYLTSNTSQLASAAALTATNVVASSTFSAERDAEGGGNVSLTGSYTGAADAVYELEITSTTIPGDPQLSRPVFAGVGNGTLTGLTASGIAAQQFTVTLEDLGTVTRAAWAPFHAATLQARTTGTAGNTYTLRVDQSGLTATLTDYSVQRALSEGTDTYTGAAYDFGGPVLEPDGSVPDTAPRLRFGDDVVVYRHWREYRAGAYRYRFSPAPQRDIPIGTPVYTVSGGRSVALYDGATELETYTSVSSLYSLLTQIRAGDYLDYTGAIAADRSPGGMACDDLTLQTASYVAGSERDGSLYVRQADVTLTVAAGAPSERLELTCIAAPIPGAEIWSLRGAISGELQNVVTGIAYDDGDYAFTVPIALQPGEIPPGDKSAGLELLTRGQQEQTPVLCVSNFVLGAEAQAKTFTFVWAPRPADDCDCSGATVKGLPDDDLLGIDPPETTGMPSIPADILSRVTTLTTWRAGFIKSNSEFKAAVGDALTQVAVDSNADDGGMYWAYARGVANQVSAILQADKADIDLADKIYALFEGALFDIYTELSTLPSAAGTKFDDEWTEFDTFMSVLETNVGSESWDSIIHNSYAEFVKAPGSGTAKSEIAEETAQIIARQLAESQNLTANPAPVLSRARAAIANIYVAAGLRSPFEVAVGRGNAAWQDHGGDAWFVCQDGGLLPIQPGWYYHSARMVRNDDGIEEPESTREFGIGVAIGCESALKYGDKLIIKLGPYANARATYQEGDLIAWEIIRADPLALGGGQAGDDTLTWSVRGTDAGELADYELSTTAPAAYSDGGLEFTITPGGIPFAAGDSWTFTAEGGQFKWRKDGGSWTTGVAIADSVSLSAGVSAAFATGAAPSWVVGDTYTLTAEAVNGVAHLITPDDAALSWTGSTAINWTPAGGAVAVVMIAAHTIPAGATITLSASDDDWLTVAYTATLTHSTGPIVHLIEPRTHGKWRLSISGGDGSIGWLYAGEGTRPLQYSGRAEAGQWRQSWRPANALRARAVAGEISHSHITPASYYALLSALEYAATHDDGRIGVVMPSGAGTYARADIDALPVVDPFGWAGAEPLLQFSVPIEAA